jgi:hypothetical protein
VLQVVWVHARQAPRIRRGQLDRAPARRAMDELVLQENRAKRCTYRTK